MTRPRPTQKPVTLKEVAAAAGVHPSTVSRALSAGTRHLVADDVAARVAAAAAGLGYRPDPVAASLRTGRSHMVGVLVPDIANPVFSPILGGIAEALSAHGYSTIVADAGNDRARQIELAESLMARRVDGLVLATVARDDPVVARCLERALPVVLVNRAEANARVSAVVSDDMAGMALAVDHLIGLGHCAIGHLAGPPQISTGHLRRRGFVAAMAAHGLVVDDAAIETASSYSREDGVVAARALLDRRPDLTAVAAANDLLALGLYDVLHERGLACPRDLSVVGHNDMPLVDMVAPPLTTVRIGHREMGHEAAQLLMRAINRDAGARLNIVLSPTLMIRKSTAAPR